MKTRTSYILLLLILISTLTANIATAQTKTDRKFLVGKWAFEKAYVTTTPSDVILEEELTERIAKNYPKHFYQFNKRGEFVLHTPEESSEGKFLIIENRISMNDSVMKYGVNEFMNQSILFEVDKDKLLFIVPQTKEAVQGVDLTFGANLQQVNLNLLYRRIR